MKRSNFQAYCFATALRNKGDLLPLSDIEIRIIKLMKEKGFFKSRAWKSPFIILTGAPPLPSFTPVRKARMKSARRASFPSLPLPPNKRNTSQEGHQDLIATQELPARAPFPATTYPCFQRDASKTPEKPSNLHVTSRRFKPAWAKKTRIQTEPSVTSQFSP